ncbi:hypothetical protein BY458DRAFT_542625 [Sporodiniella umbellata]|nr:hypothetical protein BY458DRAFT_542625 [Sporodiniella umbellata]
MSDSEALPGSPIPTRATTEESRLLDTSTKNYNSQNNQTVITITDAQSNEQTLAHESIQAGQPLLPVNQLTEKIQDILVFSEIKKNQTNKRAIKKRKGKGPSSSSSSGSSDTEDGADESHHLLKKKLSEWSIDHSPEKSKPLRKRDFAIDAFKLATDKWKEMHGWHPDHQDLAQHDTKISVATTETSSDPSVVVENRKIQTFQPLPSSAENIFGVAKNASVCAVLALLHERRQSGGHSTETDVFLQTLALSTLSIGLKAKNTSVQHVVLKEMLVTKWLHGRSALEWAVENNSQMVLNDKRVQAVIEDLWREGPEWREDPNHPSNVWSNTNQSHQSSESTASRVIKRVLSNFFARWASPRYQALVAFASGLVYLGLHLATVSNLDYTSDTPFAVEYIYYAFVASDLLLELTRFLPHPIVYLKTPSSWLSFTTAGLLACSAIIRFFALLVITDNIPEESAMLSLSFMLLILSTPLMIFRLFTTWSASNLSWTVAKANYIVTQCILNSLWVFGLASVVLLGFWVALGALQYEDMSPFSMLRLLILGALHTPEIGGTLYYQPTVGSILLIFYLLGMFVFVSALLTASFLATFIDINARIQTIQNEWTIQRCLGKRPELKQCIPGILVDVLFNMFKWVSRVVFRRERTPWNEKMHQVAWYIVYSPIILIVGIIELFDVLIFQWATVSKTFKA